MSESNWQELEARHTSGVYPKRPLAIVRGAGARLWDDAGNEYIDCVGGQGAANLGHCHPAIVAALAAQSQTLISCPEIFHNDVRARLLARLTALAPGTMPRAFLCNSGAEAVEAALKFARLLTGRREIIATMRGFHGRTMGALSATWEPKYRQPFEPLVPDYRHVPFDSIEALDEAIGPETAAVLLEVVQGEGGVRPASADYLREARRLCHERGALLVIDEVQTGLGRTGRLFACEHFGLEPDLLCLAKSIAGGLPMGAVLLRAGLADLPTSSHGSTFGGNPLACAAALAALDVLEAERLPERSAELGAWLLDELRARLGDSPTVREVRGLGLLVGLELKTRVTLLLQRLQTRGILALPAGPTVLRLLPPLVIERADLERVVAVLEAELGASAETDQRVRLARSG